MIVYVHIHEVYHLFTNGKRNNDIKILKILKFIWENKSVFLEIKIIANGTIKFLCVC